MNGYQMQAEAYKQYLEKNPEEPNRKYLERNIRIFEFLAGCEKEDFYELYNAGIFNEITKAYVQKAMKNVGLKEKQIKTVTEELRWLHDTLSAREILSK